ncbi:MAG TPA: hypothetical protein VET85_17675 [Stellaceae bacterium]|nr:hypothetical protein [Stellaceae bacterium]
MKRALQIEVGQRFQSIGTITGAPAFTYEVQAVFTSKVDQLHYARLVSVDDKTQIKSVASAILLNPRHFVPVASPAAA